MTRSTLSTEAVEESTYVATLTFTDAAGSAVTPTTVKWSLSDFDGNLINNRATVTATPGTSVDVVLSGDDLALQNGEGNKVAWRLLTIQATYTSTEGVGLPLNEEYAFKVRPLVLIP